MKLSDLGERTAIEHIQKILSKSKSSVGIGDDCAALEFKGEYLLVSTDMSTHKTHISKNMTPFQIGWFNVAINLSDIAAKGGKPLGVVIALGLPKNITETFLLELMKGADECATRFNTNILGGDTKENPELTICGIAIGIVEKNEFIPRRGAKPGDILAVTGKLGGAGAGYYAIKNNIKNPKAMKKLFEPIPRLREGRILAQQKTVTSCMDISDGLSSSIYQLQKINNTGFEIEKKQIPISPTLQEYKKQIDTYKYALHFGGDYELLITIPPEKYKTAEKTLKKIGTNLTAIGKVTKSKKIVIVAEKAKTILPNKGYEHFKKHDF